MPIKNYTTVVSAYESLGQIQGMLAAHGANKILVEYDAGAPVGVMFSLVVDGQTQGFLLPANVDGVMAAFQRQKVKADREQAERTAWRNIRDWVAAQMAFIESGGAELAETFLPYLTDGKGRTLYQAFKCGQLLLGVGWGCQALAGIFFPYRESRRARAARGQALWQGMPTCTPLQPLSFTKTGYGNAGSKGFKASAFPAP